MKNSLSAFHDHCKSLESPRVLELGTKRNTGPHARENTGFSGKEWVPHAKEYIGTDKFPCEFGDVDIISDVHALSDTVGEEQFDIIISCSTFEHLKYPQLAAHEVMKALRVGGVFFVQTHLSFPLHAHPHDYYRFSTEALSSLFTSNMGIDPVFVWYEFDSIVISVHGHGDGYISDEAKPISWHTSMGGFDPNGGDGVSTSYLNTCIWGHKNKQTPRDWAYELD